MHNLISPDLFSTARPQLPPLPRSERGRRNSESESSKNIFQVKGALLNFRRDVANTKFASRGLIAIANWDKSLPLSSKSSNFEKTDEGIKVLHEGVYFIYANFVFTGTNLNARSSKAAATECMYELHYGKNPRTDKRICRWKGSRGAFLRSDVARNQPCYLGFATRMNAGDELKIKFDPTKRSCETNALLQGRAH